MERKLEVDDPNAGYWYIFLNLIVAWLSLVKTSLK
ncbi:hypothetical protein F383_34122 [Gossypium arboreum]|uniref:Uncharacterized protein n=1 Tax=Gossypium arboreum TaxID=29729 RepID=A0A0B0N7S4_GOSAR|nr:hypothetical protein F383_34122 [Gossypium arboreum]